MNSIPAQHTAGDSFSATLSGAAYPASAGWQAQLVLIGPNNIVLESAADGADHAVAEEASATATWAAGAYSARIVYTLAGARHSVPAGSLLVLPDPAASGTTARSLLSSAERVLADLQAAYSDYLASGQFTVSEYTLAGRRMVFRDVAQLLQALQAAKRDVASERAAQRLAAGFSPRQQIITRM